MSHFIRTLLIFSLTTVTFACNAASTPFPDLNAAIPISSPTGEQTAVLAGGCFWGVEGVFEHLKGVKSVVSGYSGDSEATAHYEMVSSKKTQQAESVKITYDPSQISYPQLLKIFFAVAHDPTQLNRQGPDAGPQYRSVIFFENEEQKAIAQAYLTQLNQAEIFSKPIVTQLVPLNAFYPAEDYHQNFMARHPNNAYIVFNDLPKLNHLQQEFPELYKP